MSYVATSTRTTKWADWCISGVRHERPWDTNPGRIVAVEVRLDQGDSIGPPQAQLMSRDDVLRRMARTETFVTIFLVNNQWRRGAKIVAERHGGSGLGGSPFYFLRTVADGIRADNLGELPEV